MTTLRVGFPLHPITEKQIIDEVDKRDAARRKREALGRESDVRKRVKAALTKHGFHFHSAVAGAYSKAGVEDDTACIYGRYVLIESKNTEADKPTAMQIRNAQSARASGAFTLLIHHGNIYQFEMWVVNCAIYHYLAHDLVPIEWPPKWL